MTPREIVKANVEFQCDDRIGLNFSDGRANDFVGAGVRHGIETRTWQEGEIEFSTDIWGNTWHRLKGRSQGGEIFRPAIEDWCQLNALKMPDLSDPAYYDEARRLGASEANLFRVGWLPGWPFATCRYMRKMEIYFVDLIAERDKIDVLHDRVTSVFEGVIDRFGEAGMDAVMFCEDLGVQDRLLMSPTMWRDIFRPLYERLTGRAHGYGMKVIQHSCGFNWELIDDLCDAGIDCLQFDQPALYEYDALAAKLRRHRVGLFSPCDIQRVLPTGDRTLIEAETERLVRAFQGGFVAKNYGDLNGIGVKAEWDQWAYETFLRVGVEPWGLGPREEA